MNIRELYEHAIAGHSHDVDIGFDVLSFPIAIQGVEVSAIAPANRERARVQTTPRAQGDEEMQLEVGGHHRRRSDWCSGQ